MGDVETKFSLSCKPDQEMEQAQRIGAAGYPYDDGRTAGQQPVAVRIRPDGTQQVSHSVRLYHAGADAREWMRLRGFHGCDANREGLFHGALAGSFGH
jgi:hypothetical protein